MWNRTKLIVKKYYEYFETKVMLLVEQKVFIHNDIKVKYMLKRMKESETIIIVFSACTRKGLKARYNYVRTLQGIKATRLYILDDYGADSRGSYYMGHDFKFDEEAATKVLIDTVIKELSPQTIIFCGSSKGGYSALNFGLQYPKAYIVIGGPQYYLTSYLKGTENMPSFEHILGNVTPEKEQFLEYYLQRRINADEYADTQHIFIHYSNKEHTYEEHIKDLLADMKARGLHICEDVADYNAHSDISLYFPEFLVKSIEEIVCKGNKERK